MKGSHVVISSWNKCLEDPKKSDASAVRKAMIVVIHWIDPSRMKHDFSWFQYHRSGFTSW